MASKVFDICRGAIPGSAKFLPHISRPWIVISGVVIFSPLAKKALDKLSITPIPQWRVYRYIPSPAALLSRKIVIGGAALVVAACVIGAFHPYLRVFLDTPFPKSFILRFSQRTRYSITAVVGIGVVVGTKLFTSCFEVRIFQESLSTLNRVKVRFFGPQNQTWIPTPQKLLWEGFPRKMLEYNVISKFDNQNRKSPPALPAPPREELDWESLPPEILKTFIFPHAINQTQNFQVFFNMGLVCKTWRDHLLSLDCLVPPFPQCHFLWKAFRCQKFDNIEVAAFFQRYLPPSHEGDGLRFPFRFLDSAFPSSVISAQPVSPTQLAYISRQFPKASMDALTLQLGTGNNITEVANILNIFLEPGKKMFCLTIIPKGIPNFKRGFLESSFYGKLLNKEDYRKRWLLQAEQQEGDPQMGYPAQVMSLLPLLKGRVAVLRIDFRYNKDDDKGLDSIPIVQLFSRSYGTPLLSLDRIELGNCGWEVEGPPHQDREKINAVIKYRCISVDTSPSTSALTDETLLIEHDPEHPPELEIHRVGSSF